MTWIVLATLAGVTSLAVGAWIGWTLRGGHRAVGPIEQQAVEARTDPLTGLANRRAFDDELEWRLGSWRRRGRVFCLLLVDLDQFKQLNDRHSRLAGDEVLRRVARVLSASVRGGDLVARYGGEELVIILPALRLAQAAALAERIRQKIEELPIQFESRDLHITASIGMAQVAGDDDARELLNRADAALYAAKSAGRNCCRVHDGTRTCPQEDLPEAQLARRGSRRSAGTITRRTVGAVPYAATLADRGLFIDAVRRRLAESQRFGTPMSLLFVHVVSEGTDAWADHTVVEAADALRRPLVAALRQMDLVAQYDDQTFGLVVPVIDADGSDAIADRLRTTLGERLREVGFEHSVAVFCVQAKTEETLASLLARAEALLRCLSGKSESELQESARPPVTAIQCRA